MSAELLMAMFGLLIVSLWFAFVLLASPVLYDHKRNNPTSFSVNQEQKMESREARVSVHLNGGLGNQLFQIAAAYAYGQQHHKRFVLNHQLDKLNEQGQVPRRTYFQTLARFVAHDTVPLSGDTYVEPRFNYDAIPPSLGDLMLQGYFQSEKYFQPWRGELRALLRQSREGLTYERLVPDEPDSAWVSVHVRRTDYVNHGMHSNQTGVYYAKAHEVLKQLRPSVRTWHLMVFSDDVAWCRSHVSEWFDADTKVWFMSDMIRFTSDTSRWTTEELELWMMGECPDKIIANSSFSWWGSFLSTVEGYTVAPRRWFDSQIKEWSDVYRDSWFIVE